MLSMKFDGGKAVVQRILQAYGFTMQKQLHDHLGVGNGTVSTWIKRNYFPGEVVIRCALETGADLEWLATGNNQNKIGCLLKNDSLDEVPFYQLASGELQDNGTWLADKNIYPNFPKRPLGVQKDGRIFLLEKAFSAAIDGVWLLKKGTQYYIQDVRKMPGGKWKIDGVEWPQDELTFIALFVAYIYLEEKNEC